VLFLGTEVDVASPLKHLAMTNSKARERPVSRRSLRLDTARDDAVPHPSESQHDVAGVRVEGGEQAGQFGKERLHEVHMRDGVEDLRRRWSD